MEYIDLTHIFKEDSPVFPGDASPQFIKTANLEHDGFTIHEVKSNMHSGTHIDAPLHMVHGGKRISDFDVSHFFGRGVLINAIDMQKITSDVLKKVEIKEGDIVLVRTGLDKKFNDAEYFMNYPEITVDFAEILVEKKVKILGIDFASPDMAPFATHKKLLSNDVLIIENLTNLDKLDKKKFEVIALPVKYFTDAAHLRVVAKIA
jgi:kynurenine formamidase